MGDQKDLVKFHYMFLLSKLQGNSMASSGIRGGKGGNWNKNIQSSVVTTIKNSVKIPESIVIISRVYYYALGYYNILNLRQKQIFKVGTN